MTHPHRAVAQRCRVAGEHGDHRQLASSRRVQAQRASRYRTAGCRHKPTKDCTFVTELPVIRVLQAKEVTTTFVALAAHRIDHAALSCRAHRAAGAQVQASRTMRSAGQGTCSANGAEQEHAIQSHAPPPSGRCRQGTRKSISHASPMRPNGHLQRTKDVRPQIESIKTAGLGTAASRFQVPRCGTPAQRHEGMLSRPAQVGRFGHV